MIKGSWTYDKRIQDLGSKDLGLTGVDEEQVPGHDEAGEGGGDVAGVGEGQEHHPHQHLGEEEVEGGGGRTREEVGGIGARRSTPPCRTGGRGSCPGSWPG